MKKTIIMSTVMVLVTAMAINCGRKKSAHPVGAALDAASTSIKGASDAKGVAQALDTLAAVITPLVEKDANLLTDRTPFKESAEEFISAYAAAMVKYMGNEDINAAERKLPKGILFS